MKLLKTYPCANGSVENKATVKSEMAHNSLQLSDLVLEALEEREFEFSRHF